MRLFLFLALLYFAPLSATAQKTCPTIFVDGLTEIPAPGELATFTVRIDPPDKAVGVSYLWTVTTMGRDVAMVRGQGTPSVQVPWSYDHLIHVRVTVNGLPEGCPSTDSASAWIDPAPMAKKIDEFNGALSRIINPRFEKITQSLNDAPGAQLYFIISKGRSGSIRSKRSFIARKLAGKSGIDGDRITYLDSPRTDDRVLVWLVPAGATPPTP